MKSSLTKILFFVEEHLFERRFPRIKRMDCIAFKVFIDFSFKIYFPTCITMVELRKIRRMNELLGVAKLRLVKKITL